MKKLIIISILAALLPGCTVAPETSAKWKATGALIGKKAASIAWQVVLNSAVSSLDGQNKGDFLHSAAQGLRENMPSIVNSDDVAAVVRIWTPAASGPAHWEYLAGKLAETYATANPQTDAQRQAVIESIAKGLQQAASPAVNGGAQ